MLNKIWKLIQLDRQGWRFFAEQITANLNETLGCWTFLKIPVFRSCNQFTEMKIGGEVGIPKKLIELYSPKINIFLALLADEEDQFPQSIIALLSSHCPLLSITFHWQYTT